MRPVYPARSGQPANLAQSSGAPDDTAPSRRRTMATIDWLKELADQLEFHWQYSLRRRLAGLTDEEYFWEPVPGCWSIRPIGDGRFSYEQTSPAPDPPPFTTIAWRIGHIAGSVLERRITNHFGAGNF